jgi:DNA-binding GntR family transcriptional regulator
VPCPRRRNAMDTTALPGSDETKNTLSSQLVDRLREEILSGRWAPGSKLNVEKTRRILGVSLSPLREALARLIAAGLVELHDNKGYSVSRTSLANLQEITELRMEFEITALRNAIERGDLNWESDVMRALYKLNRIVRDRTDASSLEAWEKAHRQFHVSLIVGCNMPMLLNFCEVLHNLNDRYRRIFLVASGGDRNVAAEHAEIAEAAVARDSASACDKLREHIRRTGTNLKHSLADKIPPASPA